MNPAGFRSGVGRVNPRKWLRRLHAWIGLGLASVTLLFAISGFLLNHRDLMKIPALQRDEVKEVVRLTRRPASPDALLAQLGLSPEAGSGRLRVTVEAGRDVEWNGRTVLQPERWRISHDTPSQALRVDHWVGSGQAEVLRMRPNLWLHLARLHMGIGVGMAWTLLADLLALALALLSLSGFWLWGRLHGPGLGAGLLSLTGVGLTLLLAVLAG